MSERPDPGAAVHEPRLRDGTHRKIIAIVVATAVGFATFLLHYQLARELERNQAFVQINVLFEADASWFLDGFVWGSSEGSPFGGRSRVHPNVTNFINPPLRIAAAAACSTIDCDAEALRHNLALAVAPAFSGIAAAFCFLIALEIGLPLVWALTFAGLSVASFSNFLYGSIAESYPLSGAGYAVLFYLLTRVIFGGRPPHVIPWLGVGTFLVGVTVTNIVPFAVVAAAAHLWERRTVLSATWRTALWTSAASVVSLLYCLAVSAIYSELAALTTAVGQLREVSPRIGTRMIEFPLALANTILPPLPETMDITSVVKEPYPFQFTYRMGEWAPARFVLVMGLLAWAVIATRRQNPAARWLCVTAGITIAFNWGLHLFFGDELLLYSQHWQVSLLVVLSALLYVQPPLRAAGRWAVLALLTLAAWNDVQIMTVVMATLQAST